MTIELVSSDMLPVVCCECKRLIRHIPAGRQVKAGEVSHGYCEACLPIVESRWFGGKK